MTCNKEWRRAILFSNIRLSIIYRIYISTNIIRSNKEICIFLLNFTLLKTNMLSYINISVMHYEAVYHGIDVRRMKCSFEIGPRKPGLLQYK